MCNMCGFFGSPTDGKTCEESWDEIEEQDRIDRAKDMQKVIDDARRQGYEEGLRDIDTAVHSNPRLGYKAKDAVWKDITRLWNELWR